MVERKYEGGDGRNGMNQSMKKIGTIARNGNREMRSGDSRKTPMKKKKKYFILITFDKNPMRKRHNIICYNFKFYQIISVMYFI